MEHLHTIYEFGSFSEMFSDFIYVLILIVVFFIGLAIFLNAKYYIKIDDPRPTRRGGPIHFEAMRTGRIMMIFTAAIIPFMAFGIGYSYCHKFADYRDKKFKVVEGTVQNLRDYNQPKHSTLIMFSIDTVKFEIDMGHGGYSPIWQSHTLNENAFVRISYIPTGQYNGEIVKFESN